MRSGPVFLRRIPPTVVESRPQIARPIKSLHLIQRFDRFIQNPTSPPSCPSPASLCGFGGRTNARMNANGSGKKASTWEGWRISCTSFFSFFFSSPILASSRFRPFCDIHGPSIILPPSTLVRFARRCERRGQGKETGQVHRTAFSFRTGGRFSRRHHFILPDVIRGGITLYLLSRFIATKCRSMTVSQFMLAAIISVRFFFLSRCWELRETIISSSFFFLRRTLAAKSREEVNNFVTSSRVNYSAKFPYIFRRAGV